MEMAKTLKMVRKRLLFATCLEYQHFLFHLLRFPCSLEQNASPQITLIMAYSYTCPFFYPPIDPPIHPSLKQVNMLTVEGPRPSSHFFIPRFFFLYSCLFQPFLFNKHYCVHMPWEPVIQK